MILDATNRSLEIVLTSAKTTTDLAITADYVDEKTGALPVAGMLLSNSNGTSPVTVVAAPAASTRRNIKRVRICNDDTAAKTLKLSINAATVLYPIFAGVTLQVGDTLFVDASGEWYVTDANGNRKTIAGVNFPSLTVSGLVDISNASAGQIKFPATQNPSADPHTLDDYAEGTWTPTQGAGLTVVGAFSSSGDYVKIGRQVTIHFTLTGATSVAAGANAPMCGNLPFTTSATYFSLGQAAPSNTGTVVGITLGPTATSISCGSAAIPATSSIYGEMTYFV